MLSEFAGAAAELRERRHRQPVRRREHGGRHRARAGDARGGAPPADARAARPGEVPAMCTGGWPLPGHAPGRARGRSASRRRWRRSWRLKAVRPRGCCCWTTTGRWWAVAPRPELAVPDPELLALLARVAARAGHLRAHRQREDEGDAGGVAGRAAGGAPRRARPLVTHRARGAVADAGGVAPEWKELARPMLDLFSRARAGLVRGGEDGVAGVALPAGGSGLRRDGSRASCA